MGHRLVSHGAGGTLGESLAPLPASSLGLSLLSLFLLNLVDILLTSASVVVVFKPRINGYSPNLLTDVEE